MPADEPPVTYRIERLTPDVLRLFRDDDLVDEDVEQTDDTREDIERWGTGVAWYEDRTSIARWDQQPADGDRWQVLVGVPYRHELPRFELAFPGPLRDQLVAAVLDGRKTSTTGLLQDYQVEPEPLPAVGLRSALIDSDGRPVAVLETTGVRVCRVGDVDLAHAIDEGEGLTTVAEWRAAHEAYWHSDDYRGWLGDPAFTITDDTQAVLQRFHIITRL